MKHRLPQYRGRVAAIFAGIRISNPGRWAETYPDCNQQEAMAMDENLKMTPNIETSTVPLAPKVEAVHPGNHPQHTPGAQTAREQAELSVSSPEHLHSLDKVTLKH